MGLQFFGQFLIEAGAVHEGELLQALELMEDRNVRLGYWAVQSGFLTEGEADQIKLAQGWTDLYFGELAVELGLLTVEQIDEILVKQGACQLRLGEALVELELLEPPRLKQLLGQFEASQKPFATHKTPLPRPLRTSKLALIVLGLFPKQWIRSLSVPAKVGGCETWTGTSDYPHRATILISGADTLELGFASDRNTAEAIHTKLSSGRAGPPTEEELAASLGRFLEVIAKNAAHTLREGGVEARIEDTRLDVLPEDGYCFDFAIPHGHGQLILAKRAR